MSFHGNSFCTSDAWCYDLKQSFIHQYTADPDFRLSWNRASGTQKIQLAARIAGIVEYQYKDAKGIPHNYPTPAEIASAYGSIQSFVASNASAWLSSAGITPAPQPVPVPVIRNGQSTYVPSPSPTTNYKTPSGGGSGEEFSLTTPMIVLIALVGFAVVMKG